MISADVADEVGTLTLCRPERRNALSSDMMLRMSAQLDRWGQDDQIRVVIVNAQGTGFCAGLDRTEMQLDDAALRHSTYQASRVFHRSVAGFRKPLIAAVHGYALGTGFDVALMCDLRLAADDAYFGHPEVRLGGVPVCKPLVAVVGEAWARRLCYDGSPISGETAKSIGFVLDVVPKADLADRVRQAADAIRLTPLPTLLRTKALFQQHSNPESWIATDHDSVFEEGMTIRRAIDG